MERHFVYSIEEEQAGKKIYTFLMEHGYSSRNITNLKKIERSILRNGQWAYVKEELQEAKFAIRELGGEYKTTYEYVLPNSDIQRTLIHIEKVKQTQKKYPRAGGKPLKQPLLNGKK